MLRLRRIGSRQLNVVRLRKKLNARTIQDERTDIMPEFVPGNRFEEHQLLQFLWYHMTPDMRRKVMYALPQAYNNFVGSKVMGVVNTTKPDSPIEF
jgi:hypothetical protein